MFNLTNPEIIARLVAAIFVGGIIGFERERKSRPAGMKTHILVCIGACIIALIQCQLTSMTVDYNFAHPKIIGALTADTARLTAQVVSGIGFLGAGTIIMTNKTVKGLTTAASIWSVAGLGLALGYGYYLIATFGTVIIFFSLTVLAYLIPMGNINRLEIKLNEHQTTKYIKQVLKKFHINIENTDVTIKRDEDGSRNYTILYTLEVPRKVDTSQLVFELSGNEQVDYVRLLE